MFENEEDKYLCGIYSTKSLADKAKKEIIQTLYIGQDEEYVSNTLCWIKEIKLDKMLGLED